MEELRKIVRTELQKLSESKYSKEYEDKPRKAWTEEDELKFEFHQTLEEAYELKAKMQKIKVILLNEKDGEKMRRDIAKVIGGITLMGLY